MSISGLWLVLVGLIAVVVVVCAVSGVSDRFDNDVILIEKDTQYQVSLCVCVCVCVFVCVFVCVCVCVCVCVDLTISKAITIGHIHIMCCLSL